VDDTTVMYLRRKWFCFNGSVKDFKEDMGITSVSARALDHLLKGVSYKNVAVLGKSDDVLYKRIDNPNKPLPMTGLYVNSGKNNHADMVVAYHIQQGNQRASDMLYKKFIGLARMIVVKMMFKKSTGAFTENEKVDDLTSDAMSAVIMQVKKSYKPNEGSHFHSYFTSIIKNTVKNHLTAQTNSKDWLDALPVEDKVNDEWNHVKATDSVQ